MSRTNLNEDTLAEQPALDYLRNLGYEIEEGKNVSPETLTGGRNDYREVVLQNRLRRALKRLNPHLDDSQIEEVQNRLRQVDHPDMVIANQELYRLFTEGVTLEYTSEDGERRGTTATLIDFENPNENDFLAVNQFTVQGGNQLRRPDIVIFINGLPMAVFELKNPTDQNATLYSAYQQLKETYMSNIPDLFRYNQVMVISDVMYARHGTLTADWQWFVPWKDVSEEGDHPQGVENQLQTLVYGLFEKERFLDWMRNFIVYENDDGKMIKKTGLYHQYFGVNNAVESTIQATSEGGDGRVGVFWHTQGSGKSLSMVFYVAKTRLQKELRNPSFVFLTDRNDLDEQLYKTFLKTGYAHAKHIPKIADLKQQLTNPSGDIIFTTIQKFTDNENDFPLLSEASNIIVIADEAHRSQYANFARNVRKALPNAAFMGVTGTPISFNDRDTRFVFGEYVSTYKISQSIEDGATVPIYYEPRSIPLKLVDNQLDAKVEDTLREEQIEDTDSYKQKWAQLRQAIGAEDRLQQIADDVVRHYNDRGLEGKVMMVTIKRETAVRMYELITKHPEFTEEAAVVISGLQDFAERAQKEQNIDTLAKRFKDLDDPLRLVVVSDMWLTGFDVPPLHTMYLDKPLKGHTLMQAIARVNRKYKDKSGGLIVDYLGVATELKNALDAYSTGSEEENTLIPIEELIEKMNEKYDIVRSYFTGIPLESVSSKEGEELSRIFQDAINAVVTDPQSGVLNDERKERFLKEEIQLEKLFALASPHKETIEIQDQVEFFQTIKQALVKQTSTGDGEVNEEVDSVIKQLISQSIQAEGVVDIFDVEGEDKPDISIFDENFMNQMKEMKNQNVAIDVLRKLLNDQLRARVGENEVRYRSLLDMLRDLIEKYENNMVDSKQVINQLIELAEEIRNMEEEPARLGLTKEELVFYDAIVQTGGEIENDEMVKELARQLVPNIRRDLKVDWTNDEQIRARIRTNVQELLLQNGYSSHDVQELTQKIFRQAYNLYRNVVPGR